MPSLHQITLLFLFVFLSTLAFPQNVTNRIGKDHALFIAVADYDEWSKLNNPIKDAREIANLLERYYGFSTELIANPNKRQIREKIREYLNRPFEPDEQLFIYLSGHGEFIPYPGKEKEKVGKGYFIPKDAQLEDPYYDSYLYYGDLLSDIDNIACNHICLVIDACYSGAIFELKGFGRKNEISSKEKFLNDIVPYTTRLAITSGGKERTKDGIYHSPMTEKILESLVEKGGKDGIITFSEMYATLAPELIPRPIRGEFSNKNHPASDFVFLVKPEYAPKNENAKVEPILTNEEIDAWLQCKDNFEASCFESYLSTFPTGYFAEKAGNALRDLKDRSKRWDLAIHNQNYQALLACQRDFPEDTALYWKAEYILRKLDKSPVRPITRNHNMIFIEGGDFQIGCKKQSVYCENDNDAEEKVITISSFFIDPYEVTNAQYAEFLNEYGQKVVKSGEARGKSLFNPRISRIENTSAGWQAEANYEDVPIVGVSWFGANEYARFYGLKLPSEAQWEFAAKGGAESWGYDFAGSNKLDDFGWFKGNAAGYVHAVGEQASNELGVFDLNGNVAEWCADWYDREAYESMDIKDPQHIIFTKEKVVRGGAYDSRLEECLVVKRDRLSPNYAEPNLGFRCIKEIN